MEKELLKIAQDLNDGTINEDAARSLLLDLLGIRDAPQEVIQEQYFEQQKIWRPVMSASDFYFGWVRCEMWHKNVHP